MSKFSLDVLQQNVFPFATSDDRDVLLGTAFGEVGRVIRGRGVHIRKDGRVEHHTEIRCGEDELARMGALYPR
jgi:hypothetical protein